MLVYSGDDLNEWIRNRSKQFFVKRRQTVVQEVDRIGGNTGLELTLSCVTATDDVTAAGPVAVAAAAVSPFPSLDGGEIPFPSLSCPIPESPPSFPFVFLLLLLRFLFGENFAAAATAAAAVVKVIGDAAAAAAEAKAPPDLRGLVDEAMGIGSPIRPRKPARLLSWS